MTPVVQPASVRRRSAVLAWLGCAMVVLGLPCVAWLNEVLRQAGESDLGGSAETAIYGLVAVSSATVGAVLASRRPRHPVGWLLLVLGLWFVYWYAIWMLLAWRGAPPSVGSAVKDVSLFVMAACISFVLLLTPTGSLPSPRWRWWARVAAAACVFGIASSALGALLESVATVPAVRALAGPLVVVRGVAFVVTSLTIPIGVASLVVRFRRARLVERQQLRWLVAAAVPVGVAVAASAALVLAGNEVAFTWLTGIGVAILPLAIGAAILRYRLYDLDRIISRTLAYGMLTVLLGGGYAGVVLGLGQLLGQDSPLVVATATLAVAAAFQPARRRIQLTVDRRFNRHRYDAGRTIEAFGARLRQQVDLDNLTTELLAVVEQTMQPTSASFWLRSAGGAPSDQRDAGAFRAASPPAAASGSAATAL